MLELQLKGLSSPDLPGLEDRPADARQTIIAVSAGIGSETSPGADQFLISVCTPAWLERHLDGHAHRFGRGLLIVKVFDWKVVTTALEDLVSQIQVETWEQAVTELSRFGLAWEFEGVRPMPGGTAE